MKIMKNKMNVASYAEVAVFVLILLSIIFVLLKLVPTNIRYGLIIAISTSMILMPLTNKKNIDQDERNYLIELKAKALAFNMLEIVFGILILIFSIMHIAFNILIATLSAYLVLKMVNLIAFSYYHKNN